MNLNPISSVVALFIFTMSWAYAAPPSSNDTTHYKALHTDITIDASGKYIIKSHIELEALNEAAARDIARPRKLTEIL